MSRMRLVSSFDINELPADLRRDVSLRRDKAIASAGMPCPVCGQWVGHWGGGVPGGPEPCSLIPLNVQLEEVRPRCVEVQRHSIGDSIRAVCDAKGT